MYSMIYGRRISCLNSTHLPEGAHIDAVVVGFQPSDK